jgi:adenylyl- and sulfurtransferase ThiI
MILRKQQFVRKHQRSKDNQLCKIKCESGSGVHNFTSVDVPGEVAAFLEDGLKNVPKIDVELPEVVHQIEAEVKEACKNLFVSIIGFFEEGVVSDWNLELPWPLYCGR